MGNDYQNQMSGPALSADKKGEATAGKFGTMTDEYGMGKLDKWGLLPNGSMPLDHVFERQEYFRTEIHRTLTKGPDLPFMSDKSIADSRALHTQQTMLDNYISDGTLLPQAEQAFNVFAPMANLAAKSAVKTNDVGASFGIDTRSQIGDVLDDKHAAALKKAVVAQEGGGGLDRQKSVTNAAGKVASARSLLIGSTNEMAAILTRDVVKKLNSEINDATKEKKEIQEKIEKAEMIAKGIETVGSLMAGGAGISEAMHAHELAGKIGGAGDAVEAGGGVLGSIVGAGMTLYYEGQMRELDSKITAASGEIKGWGMATEALELEGKKKLLKGHADAYKDAVQAYEDAIMDRRMAMAKIGAEGDKNNNKGKPQGKQDNVDSAAMLWVESLMETKVMLDTGITAGNEAKGTIQSVSSQVSEHRNMTWEKIEDIWGNGPGNREGSSAPEIKALGTMGRLTDSWIRGATDLKARIDGAVGNAKPEEKGAAGTVAKAGFSGQF